MQNDNKYQVFVDENKCIGCMNCIRNCPMVFPITMYTDDESTSIKINPDRCITCGKCVNACSPGAINYMDDTDVFFNTLLNKKNVTVICNPSIKKVPNYKNIFGYLKQSGINLILSDSISEKIYLLANKLFSDECRTTNTMSLNLQYFMEHVTIFYPDLIKYLPSILNSAYLSSIYSKHYKNFTGPLVYLTNSIPFVSNSKNRDDLFNYFITFTKLENYFQQNQINILEYPELDFDKSPMPFDGDVDIDYCIDDSSIKDLTKIKIPSERDFNFIYKKLGKIKESQKKIDCNCCGYKTCKNLAIAIYNNLTNENNCIFYLKNQKRAEKLNFENTNSQMKQINEEIGGLLSETTMVAMANERNKIRINKILDNLIDIVIVTDSDFLIQSTNLSFENVLGYSEQEVLNSSIINLFPLHASVFNESVDSNGSQTLSFIDSKTEIPISKKNGDVIQCEIGMSKFELDNENSLVFIIRDISQRSEIEKMKDQFISTVSHELRTPLTSIKGSLGLVISGALGVLPDKATKLIDIANNNCTRLTNLINDILDIEKICAGKMEFKYEELEVDNLIKESIDLNQPYAENLGVSITEISLINNALINVDKSRFMQVMSNLISNAAKFSNKDSKIEIITERINDKIKISIKDRGIGIPKESEGKLFKFFSQLDSTDSRAKGGTGLGLSISKSIIEQMHGKINFESTIGEGSTFFFILPEVTESIKH